ncbi:mannosyltransferase family protein [Knoellia sp. p5-6-4]|uniref:mannosyltransferase family protein n=1 Tax=unclassified Knoellia TaxID=2618719 RepID=UPI0023DAD64A|nr:mannosyltransferase family protein [Knoellia sp. p5-6-4]MDF2144289.1 mannosyltransferase family protein [Knoellia sp. p5-6-4]
MATLLTAERRSELAGRALRRPVLTLMAWYAATRVLALVAMQVAAAWFQTPAGVGHLDPSVGDILGLWDGVWYRRIAEGGYPLPLPADPDTGLLTYSAWAFYPGFPLLVRGLMQTGLPFTAAAVALNVALGAVAVLLVWQAFRFALHAAPQPARERLALVAAALWCLYPATGILLMPYTEALACVLVAAALLLLMRRQYVWVGVVALALGFTRGVAPALACAALAHLVIRWREDRAAGMVPLRGQRGSAAVMLAATAASAVAWPVLVGVASGLPRAFFDVQAAWGQQPDRGPFVLWVSWAWGERGVFGVVVLLALVATYVALVLGRHGRWLAIELRAWALAYPLYLMAVVRPITSMWRFLLLDFPLAALVASVAMRTSTGAAVVPHWRRRVAVVVLALGVGVFWFTAALLTFTPWDAAPP